MKEDKECCLLCVNKSAEAVNNPPAYNALIVNKKKEIEEILQSFLPDNPEVIKDLWENFDIKVIKQ